jgi:hypothetical protein
MPPTPPTLSPPPRAQEAPSIPPCAPPPTHAHTHTRIQPCERRCRKRDSADRSEERTSAAINRATQLSPPLLGHLLLRAPAGRVLPKRRVSWIAGPGGRSGSRAAATPVCFGALTSGQGVFSVCLLLLLPFLFLPRPVSLAARARATPLLLLLSRTISTRGSRAPPRPPCRTARSLRLGARARRERRAKRSRDRERERARPPLPTPRETPLSLSLSRSLARSLSLFSTPKQNKPKTDQQEKPATTPKPPR